jgi:HAD superfamily hydrolase (TIGR01509 family)
MKFKGFIFDLDGTLVDSALDFSALRAKLGLPEGAAILESIQHWEREKQIWANEIVLAFEKEGAEASKLMPGASEFIHFLEQKKIPKAVFTRNAKEIALATLERHNLPFSLLIAREDAPPKPLPDGLHLIQKKFGLHKKEILFVGDFAYDLMAGLAAEIPTALYLPKAADFSTEGAYLQFSCFTELFSLVVAANDSCKAGVI